jgi:hypothetical protein
MLDAMSGPPAPNRATESSSDGKLTARLRRSMERSISASPRAMARRTPMRSIIDPKGDAVPMNTSCHTPKTSPVWTDVMSRSSMMGSTSGGSEPTASPKLP